MKKRPEKKETVVVGPNFLAHWFVYDYERCETEGALAATMEFINHHGYDLISVTQDAAGVFTVFFRRRACG